MIDDKFVKIPFWKTVGTAYGILFRNLGEFVRLTWVLLVITYGINFGLRYYAAITLKFYWFGLTILVLIVAASIFAVAWHRMILLDEVHRGSWGFVAFGKRDFLFALIGIVAAILIYGFAFFLVAGISVTAGSLGAEMSLGARIAAYFLSLILLGFVGTRFALIFPRIAIDKKFSLTACWRASKGNTLRLYFGNFVAGLGLFLVGSTLTSLSAAKILSMAKIPEVFVTVAALEFIGLFFMFGAIGVAAGFLSLSFKILSPNLLGSGDERARDRVPLGLSTVMKNAQAAPRYPLHPEDQDERLYEEFKRRTVKNGGPRPDAPHGSVGHTTMAHGSGDNQNVTKGQHRSENPTSVLPQKFMP